MFYLKKKDDVTGCDSEEVFDVFTNQVQNNFRNQYDPRAEIYIVFLDRLGSIIDVGENNLVLPGEGGIISPENRLSLVIEYMDDAKYDVHTIEVHNPSDCNLSKLRFKHLDVYSREIYTNVYESIMLDGYKVLIDFAFLRDILKQDIYIGDYEFHKIFFEATRDSQKPQNCMIRFFASAKKKIET